MKNLSLAQNPWSVAPLLLKNGYCLHKSTVQSYDLLQIIKTFIALTSLPDSERKQWQIDADNDNDPDDGLIERNGGPHDQKFFFHYKSMERILSSMKGTETYGRNKEQWDLFLSMLNELHKTLSLYMEEIISSFHYSYPQYGLKRKIQEHPEGSRGVLRLLYYKPGHTVTAKPHYDPSLFTFHVADSHPGLIVGKDNEKEGTVYKPSEGTILLFPGIKAELATNGLLQAAYHTAIADDITMQQGRWSIVFFYHCKMTYSNAQLSEKIREKLQKEA
jgi:hypothetical protein